MTTASQLRRNDQAHHFAPSDRSAMHLIATEILTRAIADDGRNLIAVSPPLTATRSEIDELIPRHRSANGKSQK